MASLTAVLPCHNAEPYLGDAIASVRRQAWPVEAIVVVDDCSTDGSAALAASLGATVLTTPRNLGAAAARNLGLRHAKSELVAWLDADDFWDDDHLATVVPLLERYDEAVLAFSLARSFGAEVGDWPALLPAGRPVDAREACLRRCVVPHNAVVVRRHMVLAAGGYDESMRLAEDFDLWLRLARRHPFVCSHRVTANWRRYPRQTSAGDMSRYWDPEYGSRARVLAAIRREDPPQLVASSESVANQVWRDHLLTAWSSRNARHMRYHLSQAHRVPTSASERRRWRRRLWLMPAARVWDRIRPASGVIGRLRLGDG